jgi:hypothetical protein
VSRELERGIAQAGARRWCGYVVSYLLQDTSTLLRHNGRIMLSDGIYFAEGAFIAKN